MRNPTSEETRTKPLLEHQANKLLKCHRIAIPGVPPSPQRAQEAIDAAEEIGYPVALKTISQDVLHKSDIGCVKLGLNTPEAVACAFDDVIANARTFKQDARISGVLVSKMDEKRWRRSNHRRH